MANLIISTVCNQACPYCFTHDHIANTATNPAFLQPADWPARLDFVERSGIEQVRLLGGEPTLHPQFSTFLEQALQRNKRILIFTNGLMPDPVLLTLAELEDTVCRGLVNINEPRETDGAVFEKQRRTLKLLGRKAQPGFTIYRSNFQLNFFIPLIAETGCYPSIRLGLAQPCLSGDNRYLHCNQYIGVGERITRFAIAAAAAGVRVELDCGFVRCMFSDENIATLQKSGADLAWRCSPILDIDPQGQVIHCFPLSRLIRLPLTADIDAATLRARFEAITRPYRQTGIFQECHSCAFKISGECPGGCLAVTLRRFRQPSFRLTIPAQEATA